MFFFSVYSLYFLTVLKISNFSLCSSNHFLNSLNIFMIITLNSLLDRFLISTSLSSSSGSLSYVFIWNTFLCHLGLPNLLFLFLCISTLEKWPHAGDSLCIPAAQTPLVFTLLEIFQVCCTCGLHGAFCCSRLSVSGLVGMTGPQSNWLPSPTYAEAAGHCLWDWVSRLLAA